jgi:hypothetical protein
MRRALLLAAFAALASCAPQELPAQTWQRLDFSSSRAGQTISADGAQVTVVPIAMRDGNQGYQITIDIAGLPQRTERVLGDADGNDLAVGIGRLATSDTHPTVVIQNFFGGAHCCTTVTAYLQHAGAPREVRLGNVDGQGLTAWPQDLDDDGTVDFLLSDRSLNYQFSSYAGSFSIPVVQNIRAGVAVDVTNSRQFIRLIEQASRDARIACLDQTLGPERNGGCAAYVVAETRLGRGAAALAFASRAAFNGPDAVYPSYCRVEMIDCPEGQVERFSNFRAAMVRYLEREDAEE